ILYKPDFASSSVVIPKSICFLPDLYASDRTMRISHVPELRTGWFFSAPDPKIANWVSWPVATTGIPIGMDVSPKALELMVPITVPASTGVAIFSIGKLILLKISAENPLVLILVIIEVPAIVISLTISPVSRNENIDGIKRNVELFSTISGFCSTNQISLLIVLNGNGRTPLSLYNSLRDRYLSILSIIGLVRSHCHEITG